MPVAVKDGESPIKCKGKLFIIDGGFSKAYQKKQELQVILLFLILTELNWLPMSRLDQRDFVIREETDIHSDTVLSKRVIRRKRVGDTDNGKRIKESIKDLGCLVTAYRKGEISERISRRRRYGKDILSAPTAAVLEIVWNWETEYLSGSPLWSGATKAV